MGIDITALVYLFYWRQEISYIPFLFKWFLSTFPFSFPLLYYDVNRIVGPNFPRTLNIATVWIIIGCLLEYSCSMTSYFFYTWPHLAPGWAPRWAGRCWPPHSSASWSGAVRRRSWYCTPAACCAYPETNNQLFDLCFKLFNQQLASTELIVIMIRVNINLSSIVLSRKFLALILFSSGNAPRRPLGALEL